MQYILDFDGVIFNKAAFKRWLAEHDIAPTRDKALVERLEACIESGLLDMQSFLYPDAKKFLAEHTNVRILSSAVSRIDQNNETSLEEAIVFQKFKIEACGLSATIVGEHKREALEQMLQETQGEKVVFVDDTKEHLDDSLGADEKLVTLCMRREDTFTFESIRGHGAISNFEALEDLENTWEQENQKK